MSTRSAIGYELPSGRIKAVYCHNDGEPKFQLPDLTKHYNSIEKAKALVKPGSMSSLRTRHTWTCGPLLKLVGAYVRDEEGLLMYHDDREPQPLYYHERGEDDPPQINASIRAAEKLWRSRDCEHMYIYLIGHGWEHYDLL